MSIAMPGIEALFHTPDEWVAVLRDLCEVLTTGLDRAVADATREIDDAPPGVLEGLGFLAGPVPGALWAAGVSDHAKDELRARLTAAAREVSEALERLRVAVFAEADEVMGNPARLMEASAQHVAAKELLEGAQAMVHLSRSQVDRYWRGRSERAFVSSTGFQVAAMACFDQWLTATAEMLSATARDIKLMWSELLDVLVDFASGLLRDLASAFDLGNALAFEVGPILSTVATCIDAVAGIGRVVRDAAARAETVMTTQWELLRSSAEVPKGRWPRVDDLDLSDLSDPDRWRL